MGPFLGLAGAAGGAAGGFRFLPRPSHILLSDVFDYSRFSRFLQGGCTACAARRQAIKKGPPVSKPFFTYP
ncbi:hypothetical protein D3Z52_18730 [Clostridiaceae bacterium]|nr:hypothetical protein [Clostridiaceae bacterium]